MKFEHSNNGLESVVSEKEVKDSKNKIVVSSVAQSKEWKDHIAHCTIGRLEDVNVDGRIIKGDEVQQVDAKQKAASVEESVREQQVKVEQTKEEDHTKHNPIAMKNAQYFGAAGNKKVLAGCACGKDVPVNVNTDIWTQYGASLQDNTFNKDDSSKQLYVNPDKKEDLDFRKTEYLTSASSRMPGRKKSAFDFKYGFEVGTGAEYG